MFVGDLGLFATQRKENTSVGDYTPPNLLEIIGIGHV